MKNLSLALNGILIVAVVILYYFQFSNNTQAEELPKKESTEEKVPTKSVAKIDSKIGYINIDSLQNEYKLHEELTNKLKAREKKYKKELDAKSSAFEKKVMDFQKKAPTMTQFEGQTKQKELAEEEQRLYKMSEDFEIKLQNEQIKLNDELQNKIKGYIRDYNADKKYDIIIGASSRIGNMVLYFNEGIDISKDIANGLNDLYDEENEPKEE